MRLKLREYLLPYLLKENSLKKSGKIYILKTCPYCNSDNIATLQTNIHLIYCPKCNKKYDLIDYLIKSKNLPEEDVYSIIKEKFNLKMKIITTKEKKFLEFCKKNNFSLIPIVRNSKIPLEKNWTIHNHYDINEWLEWLEQGLNIGVKTGKDSGITVIDIDSDIIPPEFGEDCFKHALVQKTERGYHLIFKYDKELPTCQIKDLKIDILNDGKQCIIYPSVVKGAKREFLNFTQNFELQPITEKIKHCLLSYVTNKKTDLTFSEKIIKDIESENFNFDLIPEGQRNNILIRLGGIFRKELSSYQTEYVIRALNKFCCKPPLPDRQLNFLIRGLDNYIYKDELELVNKIVDYLKIVEGEASQRDIEYFLFGQSAKGENKKRSEKALSYLVKEDMVIKKGHKYILRKKAEWKEEFVQYGNKLAYKVPYFDDYAVFREGDLIIIGGHSGVGKSHISMNMVKRFVEQGIKPYYVSLEAGNRFINIAKILGLKEGDFKWLVTSDVEHIELEKRAVTIIDWVLPRDYASTDKLYQHFTEELIKKQGLLIVFVQIRKNGQFFAEDLLKFFPSFVARFFYEKEDDGRYSYFITDKIRESKLNKQNVKISLYYDWSTKLLIPLSELDRNNKNEQQ